MAEEISLTFGDEEFEFTSTDDDLGENKKELQRLAAAAQSGEEGSSEELSVLKETMADEIVRRKKLAGDLEGEDEIKTEREYLENLSATRLAREWDRAPEEVSTEASTEEGKKADESDKYAEAGL